MACVSDQFDVIAISETWCNSDSSVYLHNFNSFEKNRLGRIGGGVCVFVKKSIQSTRYSNYVHNNSTDFEITWVITRPTHLTRNITVIALCCVYLPPNLANSKQYDLFKALVSAYENISKKYIKTGFIITGDFNRWKFSASFRSSTSLKQIVNFNTFYSLSQNKSSTLDLYQY